MFLKLSVISHNGLVPAEPLEFHVEQSGGVIGRLANCTFVLPDPEKFVSRQHGVFKFENGSYLFTDTSAAGTYLSRRDVLLHHDTVALTDGDVLKMGNYELLAQIVAEVNTCVETAPSEEEPWPSAGQPQPPEEVAIFPEIPLPDIFPAGPVGSGAASAGQVPSYIDQPDAPPEHSIFIPPEPEPQLADFNVEELLKDIAPGAPSEKTETDWQFPEEFFEAGPPQTENVPAEPEPPPIRIPTPGGVSPPRQAPGAETGEMEPIIPGPAVTTVREPATAPVSVGRAPGLTNRQLFQLFLDGAGIDDPSWVKEEQVPELMRTLGIVFHDLVEGLISVLRARAEIKREFRVDVTMMRAVDNNPLKSMPSAKDAIKIMLAGRDPGFLGPVESVREGFRDLINHQMATSAGVQASLAYQMRRFDPKKFEKRYEEGIVFQKKAKCWDDYCQSYPDLVTEALENIFGEEFREVYEQQLRNLRSTSG